MSRRIYTIAILLIQACIERQEVSDKSVFKVPVINQLSTQDTFVFFNSNWISDSYPHFAGKFKFSDTIHIDIKDTSYRKDFIFEGYENDTLATDGLEIIPDYLKTAHRKHPEFRIGNYYFPVFIVNNNQRAKDVYGKDDHLFAIQEALDSNGYWRPIEQKGWDFCGNGTFSIKLKHREFVVMLMPKYEGAFKTKLRIRFQNYKTTYVSKPFDGLVNYGQFKFQNSEDLKHFKEKPSHIQSYFYGALPAELDNE